MEFRKVLFSLIDNKVHASVFINGVMVVELIFNVNEDGTCVKQYRNDIYVECTDNQFMTAIELAAMRFVGK